MKAISFKASARTIDHLGREQIADCPTAISEIWKNAYDAYARRAELHVFDGSPAMATLFDDGHGMSREEFESRWLTIGTESKVEAKPVPEEDRLGLAERPRQGQKGIGRLSIAFLGPLVLVVSKRIGKPFVASLVDWRLFENPYALLDDLRIPVVEFDQKEELWKLTNELFEVLTQNVWPSVGDDSARAERLKDAWTRADALAKASGRPILSEEIGERLIVAEVGDRHLADWPVWSDKAESGTAMVVIEIQSELRTLLELSGEGDDEGSYRSTLRVSFSKFIDTYSERGIKDFAYDVIVHRGRAESSFVSSDDEFGLGRLRELEHAVEGSFDGVGRFTGSIKSFGRDWRQLTFSPTFALPSREDSRIGPFDFCIGTFEQLRESTSHSDDEFEAFSKEAKRFGGFLLYRDGLRILPYGLPESDFLGMEERRQKHAGREFWAHRRSFGRVALTRAMNPNLRDKAGREGFIDNTASRALKDLLVAFLKHLARVYFGYDSKDRDPIIEENKRRYLAEKAAAKGAQRSSLATFRTFVRERRPALDVAVRETEDLLGGVRGAVAQSDIGALTALTERVERAAASRLELQPPVRPRQLKQFEDEYREYRDRYLALRANIEALMEEWRRALDKLADHDAEEVMGKALGRHQDFLVRKLKKWEEGIDTRLKAEASRIKERFHLDRQAYYGKAAVVKAQVVEGNESLELGLNELERLREQFYTEFHSFYMPYQQAIEKLAEGIDLDSAMRWSEEERAELEERNSNFVTLAQTGIALEITGHELEEQGAIVSRNLRRMPADVQNSEAWKTAVNGFQALMERLRFLRPLQRAGANVRQVITGEAIAGFISGFFGDLPQRLRIKLVLTPAFRSIRVTEFTWRVFPVFLNLLNNAFYWVRQVDRAREVIVDIVGDEVVVADSGPGVDPDDVDRLFELFFSKRVEGRGVGLYLCRANLTAGGHTIRYLSPEESNLLPGTHFGIRLRGLEHGPS